jgi:Uma2 family endonuclease
MAARPLTLVSEQDYLGSHYEPDCEFEDGVLIERHVGTEKHSWLQAALAAYIFRRRKAWGVNVCIVQGERPATPIFELPPLVAIEILSPEDRPLRVDRTIAEWLEFGVGYVWVIDPETLESILHTSLGRVPVADATLRIAGTGIEIPLLKLEED